jgi:hypothetical protein
MWRSLGIRASVALVLLLALAPVVRLSGIWDPFELDNAELARRIAGRALGAPHLVTEGETLPTLSDLGMGELPFTSMALGFKLLGLSELGGRLPLALWGVLLGLVVFELGARLESVRTGLYAVLTLVAMPLFFVQARTMLGDVVTMAAFGLAFAGLTGALAEEGLGARAAWLVVAALGLAAGYLSRGLLFGVAAPALGVGGAWLALRSSAPSRRPGGADAVGALALLVGLYASARGVRLFLATQPGDPMPRALGFALLAKPAVEGTFDLPLRQLGHALFPLSAFVPLALGRLLRLPPVVERALEGGQPLAEHASAARSASVLRASLVSALGTALAAHMLVAPRAGGFPFVAVGLLALAAAIAVRDLEDGAPASPGLVVAFAALAFVLYGDVTKEPARMLAAFGVDKPSFPKAFEESSRALVKGSVALFVGLTALAWLERDRRVPERLAAWAVGLRSDALGATRALVTAWDGNVFFGLVVLEAALVGTAGMVFFGRRLGWKAVSALPDNLANLGVNLWWALPLALALVPLAARLVLDALAAVLRWSGLPRGAVALIATLGVGALLSFAYYPALAAQLSPKEAFEVFASKRRPGEPLGLLGVRPRVATYYGASEALALRDASQAYAWLTEGSPRRWLVLRAEDLPRVNSLFRRQAGRNLPVVDARSSLIFLASSSLEGGENHNPLGDVVLDEPRFPARRLDHVLEGTLEVLGWEVADASGRVVPEVVPQKKYSLRTYYRVIGPVAGTWKAFLHVDGQGRRHNGDHALLGGRYATSLWQPGDVLVDTYELVLEPNFLPGDYAVYFGLFAGDTRMEVTEGRHHDNRIVAGVLRVR